MLDLATIGIAMDTSGLEKGARALDAAEKSANKAATAADKVGKASTGAASSYESVRAAVDKLTSQEALHIQKLVDEYKQLGMSRSQMEAYRAAQSGMSKGAQELAAAVGGKIDALKREQAAMEKSASVMTSLKSAAAGLLAGISAGAALGKIVAVQREFDVLNSSLKTVTGSSAAAALEMEWIKQFAKETPFGLAQAAQAFVKMKALGLDPTRAALTSFGNTASAMGKDLNQMIEAVADASTGEFERLKEFGIKARKQGDDVSLTFQGVTTKIGNSAAEIKQYLEDIGNTKFAGAMEERAKTLDGTIAALGDSWDELFRTVSANNVGGVIFDSVTLANGALEDANTILLAMAGASQEAGKGTGALATIQNGLATIFETVAVLGANLKFVLVGIGNEIGGLAAQVAQAAQFNFSGVAAIRAQMVADAEAARREIDATTDRILNARKAQEEYARWSTRNASAATDPRRVDLSASARPGGTRPTGKPTKEVLSDYDKLIQKLGGDLTKAAAAAESAQNGYNKSQEEFVALAASPVWAKFTNQQRAQVAALFEQKIAGEEAADAFKTLEKANLSAAAAREKYIASLDTGLEKIQADIAAQNEATARMGLSKEAIAALDAAKLEMLATDTELQAIKALDRNLDEQTYQALKKQAAAYRDLAKAKQGGAAKETALDIAKADADAAKKAADEWQKTADSINSSLTDALMRGFESGKGFAMNLRDTVVNMFKTMVLRPIISAVLSPISGALMGGMGLSGAANAGTSALGTVGNLASGASLLGGLGTFGGGLSAGFGGLMGTLGIGATTGATLGGAMSAGGIALGAGNIMGGLGTIAGALGPIALGVALIASLIKPRTYHSGGAGSYSAEGGASTGLGVLDQGLTFGVGASHYDKAAETAAVQVAKSISGLLDSTAKVFGKDAGYYAATAFADDSSKDGAWGSLIIRRLDETIVNWADTQTSKWAPKVFADGDAGKAEYMQQLAASTKQAILSIGLPEWAQRIAASMPDSGSMEDLSAMLAQIQGYPAQLLQAYGTSRDDLVNLFVQGLQSGNAQAAGQSVADTLVGSIQNAVYGQAAGQIFDIVNMGIVTPMLDAIATGASVSEALSQATIDATIKRAKEQAAVLAELFGNAEFTAALEQIRGAVGSALGQAGASIQRLPFVAQQIDTAAQDAAQAATEAANKWQQITDNLLGTRLGLAIELLRAQGKEEQALAMERAEAIKGMDAYQVGLYDANQGTRALIDSLTKMREISEQLASELPGVVSKYLTPEQNTANSYSSIAGDLIKAGLSGMGAEELTRALTGASKGEIAQAAVAVYNMAGVTDEMRLALVRAAGGLADLKTEAEGLQRSETDNAMAALEKAVNARKALLQESIDDIRAVFETVRDNARDLYGEVESTARGLADAGRAFIDNALSAAKLTGYLPDGKALSEAIGDVRKGIGETQYKTQIDADRDRLVLAGKLSQLQAISGDQLTEAEKQLKALDDLLASSHSQIDALRGIDASVMSVEAAVAALAGAMGREKAGGGGGGGRGKPGSTQTVGGADTLHGANGAQYSVKSGMGYQSGTGLPWFADDIRAIAADLVNAGNGKQVYDLIKSEGYTLKQADTILGLGAGTAEDWARAMGLPIYHNGTDYVPKTGMALLQQGEAVIPRAANNGGGNAEVVAELKALRVSNERLESRLKAIEQSNENMAIQQTNYTEDGNAARVEIMNVKALAVEIAKEMA